MKHNLFIITLLLTLFLGLTKPVFAVEPDLEAGSAANLAFNLPQKQIVKDNRVTKLKSYLEKHNSPLIEKAEHFVNEADRYNLDWKLVAAIAGVESTFGKFIPTQSYNGWGWAVFTGKQSGAAFENWEEGITTVSKGLRENYINRGAQTIEQMGRRYAASPTWAWKVNFFLKQIEAHTEKPTDLDVVL